MVAESLLAALVRGLGLVGMAAVIGGLVLDQLILPADAPELVGARRRLRRWVTGCLVALTLNVKTSDTNRPRGWKKQAAHQLDCRRLARAVGTEECE